MMKKKPVDTWSAIVTEPSFGYDLMRMFLGVALFVRGGMFIADPSLLGSFLERTGWFWSVAMGHYIAMAHLGGGIMLALGVGTRIAAAVQIPILAGAVFFVHWSDGLAAASQSLELAGLVLFMLLVYATFGAGPLSVDQRVSQADHFSIGESLRRARARLRRRRIVQAAEQHV
jgi:putative oxidoreductase